MTLLFPAIKVKLNTYLVFHQLMHSYILLKYYHRQLIYQHFSLLHVSIRTDHHQGVLLVLAKLLIKIIKL